MFSECLGPLLWNANYMECGAMVVVVLGWFGFSSQTLTKHAYFCQGPQCEYLIILHIFVSYYIQENNLVVKINSSTKGLNQHSRTAFCGNSDNDSSTVRETTILWLRVSYNGPSIREGNNLGNRTVKKTFLKIKW